MRVLVTGSAGHIGRRVTQKLTDEGYEIRTFDRAAQSGEDHHPGDLRDIFAVRRAVQGCDAVIHLGALSSDGRGTPEDVLAVNVQGTWNVLLACAETEIKRVIYFSSVNSLGNFGGHRPSLYLPIGDDYPHHPMTPYQLSKHLGEEACKSFTERYGMTTICFRPMLVADFENARWLRRGDMRQREEWMKIDYWSYVDIHDVVDATLLGLKAEGIGHASFLLAAADTLAETPTAELVDTYCPDTPWPRIRREEYLAGQPNRSLIDCSQAFDKLGWKPRRSWRDYQNDEK
jgi:nucleoside-diphosphate-sugar epimerase